MHRPSQIALCWLVLASCVSLFKSYAQGLREHPTPFSVWLDVQALYSGGARRPALPIWLESLEKAHLPAKDDAPPKTTFRLRFRRLEALNQELQLRVFFNDLPEANPTVSAWSETGTLRYEKSAPSLELNLPASETFTIPMAAVDYIDVQVVGDGSNVRGLFAATLQKTEVRRPIDFPAAEIPSDPFGNPSLSPPSVSDDLLFGRVEATLDPGLLKLSPRERPTGSWEFELEAPPLIAVLIFEILNVDATFPPEILVNDRPLGPASLQLPDLADPGFLGHVRPLDRDMRFRYSGWLRCQKVIPGSALQAGLNKVVLQLNRESGPVAIRAVVLQLKYNWQNLDYTLNPALP